MVKKAEVSETAKVETPAEVPPAAVPPIEIKPIPPLPEAGGVAWCELWGTKTDSEGVTHDVKINVTARAVDAKHALIELLEAVKDAQEFAHLYPYQRKATAPAQAKAATPPPAGNSGSVPPAAANNPPAAHAAPPAQPAEPVYEPVGEASGMSVINAVLMTTTPRADGKCKVDFYEANHRYPDIACVMSPDQLVKMLEKVAPWTPAHFTVAKTYDVNYKVTWQNSTKMNQYGRPYKNIVSVDL